MLEQLVVNRSFPEVRIPGFSVVADVVEDTSLFGVPRERVIVALYVDRDSRSATRHLFELSTSNGFPLSEGGWDEVKDWILKTLGGGGACLSGSFPFLG